MQRWLSRSVSHLVLAFFWLLHLLPLPLLRALGVLLGWMAWLGADSRRKVGLVNLKLCFPDEDEAWRRRVCRRHFVLFMQALLDRSLMRWSSRSRLKRLVRVSGDEPINWQERRPTILFGIHNVGLELGAAGLCAQTERTMAVIHSDQKNPVFDAFFIAARERFGVSVSRNNGIRAAIRLIRENLPLFYFPDQDFGASDSIFLPFFGVPTATTRILPRLAQLTGARVVPHVTWLTPRGYEVELFPPWDEYPSGDLHADITRINEFAEASIRRAPAQYFWLHKRFKTRPKGETPLY